MFFLLLLCALITSQIVSQPDYIVEEIPAGLQVYQNTTAIGRLNSWGNKSPQVIRFQTPHSGFIGQLNDETIGFLKYSLPRTCWICHWWFSEGRWNYGQPE